MMSLIPLLGTSTLPSPDPGLMLGRQAINKLMPSQHSGMTVGVGEWEGQCSACGGRVQPKLPAPYSSFPLLLDCLLPRHRQSSTLFPAPGLGTRACSLESATVWSAWACLRSWQGASQAEWLLVGRQIIFTRVAVTATWYLLWLFAIGMSMRGKVDFLKRQKGSWE